MNVRIVSLIASLQLVVGAQLYSQQKANDAVAGEQQKLHAVELLKSIETGDPKPASVINPKKYIQHNPAVADGIAGFGALLKQLPPKSARVKTIRAFSDGEYVFAHTEYNFFGPKIGFDVFRFEDGRIVEHWDNLQETPEATNPSGHTMTDGAVEATDKNKTKENKELVQQFVTEILVNSKLDQISKYYDGNNYIQHNPQVADGLSGLNAALQEMAKAGVAMKYSRVHKVLGEGSFVLVMSEGEFGGKHVSFFDLFRVQGGRIAEHWDTIEAIPSESEWKNRNGKF